MHDCLPIKIQYRSNIQRHKIQLKLSLIKNKRLYIYIYIYIYQDIITKANTTTVKELLTLTLILQMYKLTLEDNCYQYRIWKSIMTTEISLFFLLKQLNTKDWILYTKWYLHILERHSTNEWTHAIFISPMFLLHGENMQVAHRAIWDRQPILSYGKCVTTNSQTMK